MNLSPSPVQQFFDNNGRPLVGGLLFTYEAGTSTPIATYSDESGTPNTNPIELDFRGECRMWLDPDLAYKFVLAPKGDSDPPTRPIWTADNVRAAATLVEITQQFIGERLWPRTQREIAAGITPADYGYPPGDVRRYGAVGDGVTDDTAALQRAIDAVAATGGGVVRIPPSDQAYMVDLTRQAPTSQGYHEAALWIKDFVTIDATGAYVEGFKNNGTHGGFVSFAGREDAHVIGGTWVGDKAKHTLPLPAGEWCFAFAMFASKKCSIKAARILDSRGDGVYVGETPTSTWDPAVISYDVEISGNQIINCGRNGISIVGAQRFVIAANVITGTWGYAPQAGIDLEPNYTYADNWGAVDGSITGNVITENHGDGITLFRSSGITVSGNTVARNGERGISVRGNVYDSVVCGNAIKYAGLHATDNADSWYGVYVDDAAGDSVNLVFAGNTVDAAKPFYVLAQATSKIVLSGNLFTVTQTAASLWGAATTGADPSSYFTSYLIAGADPALTFTGNKYRVDTASVTWRGESTFMVSIRRCIVTDNMFHNVNASGGVDIRLDNAGTTPGQFHRNVCTDNLRVGQNAVGYWSAANIDFSRSVLNGAVPSSIFVKANAPSTGWVMPDVVGNSYEFAYGVDSAGTVYRFKLWDGSTWKHSAPIV